MSMQRSANNFDKQRFELSDSSLYILIFTFKN